MTVLALISISACSTASAQQFECGNMHHSIFNSLYDFSYKSWSWPEDGHYILAHCVENNSTDALFVDWERTSLKGFVIENSSSYVKTKHASPRFAEESNTLWYGARPLGVDTSMLYHDSAIVINSDGGSEVETTSRIGVPLKLKIFSDVTEKEISDIVGRQQRSLRNITLNFKSSVSRDGKEIRNLCVYSVDIGGSGYGMTYQIGFSDTKLNEVMFGVAKPITIEKATPKGIIETSDRIVEISEAGFLFEAVKRSDAEEIGLRSATLDIYRAGLKIASLPVKYYLPE